MTRHIGIIGCSAEGASLCYRTICAEGARFLGPHAHPEISMHTPSLADYVHCLEQGDLGGVGELMLNSARKLAEAGADFIICPDNTIHQALPLVEHRMPVPFLHIADVTANEAVSQGFKNLCVTGTRWLVDSDVYADRLGVRQLNHMRPLPKERDEMDRIIMEELVYGVFKPEAVEFFQNVIHRMKEQGGDAVILGCTEIPLIINDENSPLPTLDTTRLLARAALERAIEGE